MPDEDEYRVYEVPLPGDVRGAVRIDADGFASIYINEALCPEQKKKTLDHEIRHITRGDHTSDKDIREVEAS